MPNPCGPYTLLGDPISSTRFQNTFSAQMAGSFDAPISSIALADFMQDCRCACTSTAGCNAFVAQVGKFRFFCRLLSDPGTVVNTDKVCYSYLKE